MASSIEFVEYVCEQISGAGGITYKKMFGEYGVYCNGKIVALICDNQLFVKPTENGKKLLPNVTEAPPYKGAKPCFLIDSFDDKLLMAELILSTYNELPEPKPKKAKKQITAFN